MATSAVAAVLADVSDQAFFGFADRASTVTSRGAAIRRQVLTTRVTDEDLREICKRAAARGETVSEYLRWSALR